MSLFSIAGKLRTAANKLKCYITNVACGNGICCGGEWHSLDEEGDCCGDVWYVGNDPCPSGHVFLRWGQYNECCGCIPEQIPDPRNGGGMVNAADVVGDFCCPSCDGTLLPYDPVTAEFVGCTQRCCRDGDCSQEPQVVCESDGGTSLPGCCWQFGCPIDCCFEDEDGTVGCGVANRLQCQYPATPDCATGCLGMCCGSIGYLDEMTTQPECEYRNGIWQGLGSTSCAPCQCREPFDCGCCETALIEDAANATFTQPGSARYPSFTNDQVRTVTVSGHTDSAIYIHGINVGASCDFEVMFSLCEDSFNIEPVECGSTIERLDAKVCWSWNPYRGSDPFQLRGCETATINLGLCEGTCGQTMFYKGDGATSDVPIVVRSAAFIEASGTSPLILTHDITVLCYATITLTGTNTGDNEISGGILQQTTGPYTLVAVAKGQYSSGTWKLSGASTFIGGVTIWDGRLVVGASVPASGPSPVGQDPSTAILRGAAASPQLMFADGVTMSRSIVVESVPLNSGFAAAIGHHGTGESIVDESVQLDADIYLCADPGGTIRFTSEWQIGPSIRDEYGNPRAPIFYIGTYSLFDNFYGRSFMAGKTGIVAIEYPLPLAYGVQVKNGTLRLSPTADDTIVPETPVTVGSDLGAAVLDLNDRSQSLDILVFVDSDGSVVNGVLKTTSIEATGAGHSIQSDMEPSDDLTAIVNDDSDITISGVISGDIGLTKNGNGELTLSAANTYTGTTAINGGILFLFAGGALVSTAEVSVDSSGATFDISGVYASGVTIGSLSGVADSLVSLGTRTLDVGDATSTTFAGVIAGNGSLVKQGSGTLTLSGANTYGGETTISDGEIKLEGDGSLESTTVVNVASDDAAFDISSITAPDLTIIALAGVADSAVNLGSKMLVVGDWTSRTFAGVISGSGVLKKQGAGTLTISAENTYSGGTLLTAGVLVFENRKSLGTGAVSIGSAIIKSGVGGEVENDITLVGSSSTFDSQSNANTLSGAISGGGSLAKEGPGTLTLRGSNSYSGTTTINNGTIVAGSATALGFGDIIVNSGGTLDMGGFSLGNTIVNNGGVVIP